MNRTEFESLRDLPDKSIADDIEFLPNKGNSMSLNFRSKVSNSLGYELEVAGCFKPDIPSLTFNFMIDGVGAICRLCVNNTIHKDKGRTHKHSLEKESCVRKNLPYAVARNDFNLDNQTVKEIWEQLCSEANITHDGNFIEPESV